MELIHIYLSVALIWGIAVVTPGPNFFITVQAAIGASRKSALYAVAGITAGTVLWGLCGFFGIHLLFRVTPWLYTGLKVLGGSYLIYLGIKLILTHAGNGIDPDAITPAGKDLHQHFRLGLLTNLSNPKTAAFVASLFAATMPSDASFFTGMTSVLLIAVISSIWYTTVAVFFSLNRFRQLYRKSKKWIERVAGVIFIGFGLRLAAGE